MLILASSSSYRRALLERLQLPFAVSAPQVDEQALRGETPRATALRLAENKARAIARLHPDATIIGSDQVAALGKIALGKPGDRPAALLQLALMRGQTVVFHTALCVLNAPSGQCQIDEVPTTVRFRSYTDAQCARYLDIDRPYDCAGSAKIEALGIALVESVESSDPSALIGLPLIALVTMLKRAGTEVL